MHSLLIKITIRYMVCKFQVWNPNRPNFIAFFFVIQIFLQFDIVLVYNLLSKICLMKAIKHVIKYCIMPFREHKYLDRSAIRTYTTFFLLKTINAIFCNANRGVLHVNFSALIQTKSIIGYRITLVMLE